MQKIILKNESAPLLFHSKAADLVYKKLLDKKAPSQIFVKKTDCGIIILS